jgi:Tol biopolymer transport system component/DNA-binding winged helix-turn-helix (wHTH) protein
MLQAIRASRPSRTVLPGRGGPLVWSIPVNSADGSSSQWRFGVFEADVRQGQLRRSGRPVKMREQSFRILVLLVEHAGEIVSREDLRRALWPSDTYVDFDHSLNTAVMKLREVLGDSADAPLYIETIPKRGYRFVAPVARQTDARSTAGAGMDALDPERLRESGGAVPDAVPALEPGLPVQAQAELAPIGDAGYGMPLEEAVVELASASALNVERLAQRRRLELIGAGIGLLLIAVGAYFLFGRGRDTAAQRQSASVLRIVPITTAPGEAIAPAFSPDGREIAYVWDGAERRRYDIYVQLLGAEQPLRLTYSKRGVVGYPAWSPDGREVAFSRCDGVRDGVFVVPALGGAEQQLTAVGCLYSLPSPLSWLSEGREMLMIDRCPARSEASPAGQFGVVLFSLTTGEKKCLTDSGSERTADAGFGFALSPDGKTIAMKSTTVSLCCDIFMLPLAGGPVKQLTEEGKLGCNTLTESGCSGLMWTPNGKSIVFISNRSTLPSLWHVPASGGTVERETVFPSLGSFTKDGRQFAYSEKTGGELPAIWRANLAAAGGPILNHMKVIGTQYPEMDAQPSPDGSRIVWMSIRTGYEEVWTSDGNGAANMQLTNLGRYTGTPRWSPDGKWIAFDSYASQGAQIFLADPQGRSLRSITVGPFDNVVPSWSRDGKAVYFASKRTGTWQVWRHVLANGLESAITQHGGFNAFESLDGQTVYYSKFEQAGIWSVPTSGGTESLVIGDKPQVGYWGHFAVTEAGLYLLDAEADPRPTILFYSFGTHRITPVLPLEQRPARLQPSLSATADGKTLYYTQYDRQSVIRIMEFSR